MAITPMQVDKDQSEPPSLVCQLFPRKYLTGEVLNSWDDSGSQKMYVEARLNFNFIIIIIFFL